MKNLPTNWVVMPLGSACKTLKGKKPKKGPRNAKYVSRALAHSIKTLIDSKKKIVERVGDKEIVRELRPGDISILLRTNDECEN